MAKMKLGGGGLKGFFINHVEKIVLGLVLVLLALFVWAGSRLEGTEHTPGHLDKQVASASDNVDRASWENVKANDEYQPVTDHLVRQQKASEVTSDLAYSTGIPWGGGATKNIVRRSDPELFPPIEPEVYVVTAAYARKKQEQDVDAFAELTNTEQKKEEAPKKKTKRKRRGRGNPYGEYGEMMMDEASYADETMMNDYGSMMEGMMSGMPGMTTAAAGPVVRADAEKMIGYRPAGSGANVIGRTMYVVSVRFVVPLQQQWDEFERIFSEAEGYNPGRDAPRYISFWAQRAEVPADPNAPLDWKWIWTTERVKERTPKLGFAAYPGEMADPNYTHPELTMPAPPLMMVDYEPLVLHSKVPMKPPTKTPTREKKPLEIENPEDIAAVDDVEDIPAAPSGRRPGGYGMSMGYGGEMADDYTSDMYGSDMYGAMMSTMGSMMSPTGMRGPAAEFLLLRFFDYITPQEARAGKRFVYRVQLLLEDPNHPQNPQAAPLDRILDKTVQERLATVTAEEETKKKRLYYRTTDWSEPTPPVSAEPRRATYAGTAEPSRTFDVFYGSGPQAGKKTGFVLPADQEPRGELMTVGWDPVLAVEVPAVKEVSRGSFLNYTQNADVIDPISLAYKVVEEFDFKTNQMVLDIRGGNALPTTKEDETLIAPAEYVLVDNTGSLIIRNELDDWASFDRLAPPPPIVVEAAPTTMGEGYGYGADADAYGAGGY